jgi:hypothetical protein
MAQARSCALRGPAAVQRRSPARSPRLAAAPGLLAALCCDQNRSCPPTVDLLQNRNRRHDLVQPLFIFPEESPRSYFLAHSHLAPPEPPMPAAP